MLQEIQQEARAKINELMNLERKHTQVDEKFKLQIRGEALPFQTQGWRIIRKLNNCSCFTWKIATKTILYTKDLKLSIYLSHSLVMTGSSPIKCRH